MIDEVDEIKKLVEVLNGAIKDYEELMKRRLFRWEKIILCLAAGAVIGAGAVGGATLVGIGAGYALAGLLTAITAGVCILAIRKLYKYFFGGASNHVVNVTYVGTSNEGLSLIEDPVHYKDE